MNPKLHILVRSSRTWHNCYKDWWVIGKCGEQVDPRLSSLAVIIVHNGLSVASLYTDPARVATVHSYTSSKKQNCVVLRMHTIEEMLHSKHDCRLSTCLDARIGLVVVVICSDGSPFETWLRE